jgi:diadenosine tetraphosphatase ApaH/serine/threonine PP2A family protein phosphatase
VVVRGPSHFGLFLHLPEAVYGGLGTGLVVYGHFHCAYVRRVPGMTVVNAGSVSLPYDGDRRAAYLLDGKGPAIRRVEYGEKNSSRRMGGIDAGAGVVHDAAGCRRLIARTCSGVQISQFTQFGPRPQPTTR